ncbi:MAG: hypothetical protein NUV84_03800 [Candidatus Uhrbacteria bacterium]|nr:hypothetical protein [Candidatus Uhrbacteria bacterium]
MNNKKKVVKTKAIWVVLQDDSLVSSFPTFAEAKDEVEKIKEIEEGLEVQILEVVKAWEMVLPEEPSPEIFEIGLDQL